MPVGKTPKPWWPDRTVRDNPDDPNDLSGRRAVSPNSYGESLMNDAGGDDKGLEKPDPRGDSEPKFRSLTPSDEEEAPSNRLRTTMQGTKHHTV